MEPVAQNAANPVTFWQGAYHFKFNHFEVINLLRKFEHFKY